MARFRVSGMIDLREHELTWLDGELDGTPEAIARFDELVAAGETVWATATGPHFTASRDRAELALLTAIAVFDQTVPLDVEVAAFPPLELDLPKGAVA